MATVFGKHGSDGAASALTPLCHFSTFLLSVSVHSLNNCHSHETPNYAEGGSAGLRPKQMLKRDTRACPASPVLVARVPLCNLSNKIGRPAAGSLPSSVHDGGVRAAKAAAWPHAADTLACWDAWCQGPTRNAAGWQRSAAASHITGCCMRMSVMLGRCTNCGYWLLDTAAAMGGAPDASASRASVNSTSSCWGRVRKASAPPHERRRSLHSKPLLLNRSSQRGCKVLSKHVQTYSSLAGTRCSSGQPHRVIHVKGCPRWLLPHRAGKHLQHKHEVEQVDMAQYFL